MEGDSLLEFCFSNNTFILFPLSPSPPSCYSCSFISEEPNKLVLPAGSLDRGRWNHESIFGPLEHSVEFMKKRACDHGSQLSAIKKGVDGIEELKTDAT